MGKNGKICKLEICIASLYKCYKFYSAIQNWHFAWTDKQSAELNGICLKIKMMILESVLDPSLEYLLFFNNMFLGFKGDQLF